MKGKTLALCAVVVLFSTGAAAVAVSYADVSGSITLQTNSGVEVTTADHGGGLALEDPFIDDQTVAVVTENGNVTVSGNGQASLRVREFLSGVAVEDLNSGATRVEVMPETGDTLSLNGSADRVAWETVEADDGASDVTTSVSGGQTVTIVFGGVAPNTDYQLVDGNGNQVAVGTADGSGTVALPVDESGTLRLQSFDNPLPTVTDLQPDGAVISGSVTLSATIDDDSLPGEPVDVVFRVDGSVVESRTVTSAGEQTYMLTSSELPSAGTHDWSVTATDSLGGEATAASTFGIPANMTVRNASAPNSVIAGAEATFYLEDRTVERTADANGNISLSGLPGDERIPVEINATDYRARTTIVPSVVQAESAFLLPQTETVVLNRFTLADATGEFDSESTVIIERPLTVGGDSGYRRVAGDQVGVQGFPAMLKQDQRYRVSIISQDGQRAVLGKFIATQSEEVPLRPETVTVDLRDNATFAYNATVDSDTLRLQYDDPAEETEVLTVAVVNRFNDSDYLIEPTTYYGTNSLILSEPVGENGINDSYTVVFEGQRGGKQFRATQQLGPEQRILVPPGLSLQWVQFIGIGLVLLVGGVFSRLNVGAGAVVTSGLAGLLWYIGLLQGVATAATVTVAITFSIVYAMVTT
jgi:hypothetical protein